MGHLDEVLVTIARPAWAKNVTISLLVVMLGSACKFLVPSVGPWLCWDVKEHVVLKHIFADSFGEV